MSITQKIKTNKGFISVVAMIIFAILIVTGLSVQRSNIDRLQNIGNTNNYYKAKYISESVMGKLNQLVESKGPGFTMDFECNFMDGAIETDPKETTSPLCSDLIGLINPCNGKTNIPKEICEEAKYTGDISIQAEIVGKTTKKVSSCSYGFTSGCYTIPEIGQGTAGNRSLMPVKNDTTRDCALVSESVLMADLNHECNWNRLSFGSSSTDRVVIPMYYTEENGDAVEYHKILSVQPHFVLRVRTPCEKWSQSGSCENRYKLDTSDGNDIVLQWQITGKCGDSGSEVDCGILPLIAYLPGQNILQNYSSAIDERRINDVLTMTVDQYSSYKAINTSTYKDEKLNDLLQETSIPVFNLFLNKPLLDTKGNRIPYLEYQFLTPSQISNPESKLSVFASFDGNSSSNTIYKSIQGALIDFAIQN